VQAVLKDGMDIETQCEWEDRAKRAWDHAFPSSEFAPCSLLPGPRPQIPDSKELIAAWSKDCPEGAQTHSEHTTLRMQTMANIRKLAQLYGTVSDTNETIIKATNREDLFHGICRDTVMHGSFVMAWIGLVNERTQIIEPVCQYPQEAGHPTNRISLDEIPEGRNPTGTAIRLEDVTYAEYAADEYVPNWLNETLRCRIRSGAALPVRLGGKIIGALTLYVNEPNFFDSVQIDFLKALSTDISSALDGFQQPARPHRAQAALQEMLKTLEDTIQETAFPSKGRDGHTMEHQQRVSRLAIAIAREMRLDEKQIDVIRFGGLIHDIGNIAIPAEILCKSGQLTLIERKIVHSHVQEGYNIVKDINGLRPVSKMILQHHERLDGFGYPAGLIDKGIVPEAKILAIADRITASLSRRPDRSPLDIDETLNKIKRYRGVHYDSGVVDACLSLFRND